MVGVVVALVVALVIACAIAGGIAVVIAVVVVDGDGGAAVLVSAVAAVVTITADLKTGIWVRSTCNTLYHQQQQ